MMIRKFAPILLSACLALALSWPLPASAWDSIQCLSSEAAGLGAIDMQKLPKRKIFQDLMAFFFTDEKAKQAIVILQNQGMQYDKALKRIVVEVPNNALNGEYLVYWEAAESLQKYENLLMDYAQYLKRFSYHDKNYYQLQKQDTFLSILNDRLVTGSEAMVRHALNCAPDNNPNFNPALAQELKTVDRKKDAWFVFALNDDIRNHMQRFDPIIDRSNDALDQLRLGNIMAGQIILDFSQGLHVDVFLKLLRNANSAATLIQRLLDEKLQQDDLLALGLENLVKGISVNAKEKVLHININYNQNDFNRLISFVSLLAKSLSEPKTP